MEFDDRRDERKAKAASWCGPTGLQSIEPTENLWVFVYRNSGATVGEDCGRSVGVRGEVRSRCEILAVCAG